MLPLQVSQWFPTWITPIWILSVGIAAGLVVSAIILAVLAILSRVPGLGTLADVPRRGNIVAAVIAVGLTGLVLSNLWARTDSEHRTLLIVPVFALCGIAGWGIVFGMWRRTIGELWSVLTEGVMTYLLGTAVVVMLIGLALTPMASETQAIVSSVQQFNWLDDGERQDTFEVPAISVDSDPDDAPFINYVFQYDPRGVEAVYIDSDRTIIIGDAEKPKDFQRAPTRIDPDTPFEWKIGDIKRVPLPRDSSEGVWIQNREIDPAHVTFRIVSQPPVREVSTIIYTGLAIVFLILGAITLRQAAPRLAAIALATAKSEMAQPLYIVLLALGAVALVIFMVLPFHTLGEDIKLLKDSGMTMIMVLGLIQAVWSAGTSIAEEIEGRTALTVLSKPVSRRSFLLGKYTGIVLAVLVMFVILGLVLMAVTAYKPITEARENSTEQPGWRVTHMEMTSVVPGLALYFMETMAIAAIGVAVATRLAMLANFIICFTIYAIGNLTSPLVQSSAGNNELVGFVGKLIAVVVPNLNTFNVQAAVDVGNTIPPIYLAGVFNYLVCFCIMALMVALLLFEDRDLA